MHHPNLRTLPPLWLAPIRRAAEIRSGATEIAPGAAQPSRTLSIDDRPAGVACLGCLRGRSWDRGFGSVGAAVTEAGLTPGAAVEGLVLDL